MIEAVGAAIVWVRDLGFLMIGAELAEEADFVVKARAGIEGLKVPQILPVHDEGEIERLQVGGEDLAGAAGERVIPAGSRGGHAGIGRLARVPALGAGGIDMDLILEAGFVNEAAHDAFGRRGAADIAQADEQEAEGSGHGVGERVTRPSRGREWGRRRRCRG